MQEQCLSPSLQYLQQYLDVVGNQLSLKRRGFRGALPGVEIGVLVPSVSGVETPPPCQTLELEASPPSQTSGTSRWTTFES